MGHVIIMGGGRATVSVTYDPVFANNSWAQIIDACKKRKVPSTWNVADQKAMLINGTEYLIDIIGKNHDEYYVGPLPVPSPLRIAPLTFQLHDCYIDKYAMNNSETNAGGWASCAMRTTHLPVILASMPSEVQNGIREVNKLSSAGDFSTYINTTANKLFLLSEREIFGGVSYSASGEGIQYDYYKASNNKLKKWGGLASYWWERSPSKTRNTSFCCVASTSSSSTGEPDSALADTASGVAPAFCF